MIRQLIVGYVLLVAVAVAVAVAAFTVPVAFTLTDQLRGDTELSVSREAATMARLLADPAPASRAALVEMATAYESATPGTVQVITADGARVGPCRRRPGRASRTTRPSPARRTRGSRPSTGAPGSCGDHG
ncbi:hypothetical protein [Streptomyces sp. CC208A]|uniref:hypothetical protein n=1 Tax=Streptomyces sp. CC208A TaxID=3044573 RepID=UPI0024A9EB32|nr:hypothetical protein [Streptomyces sp. CC208A]